MIIPSNADTEELKSILSSKKGEREIAEYLKKYPILLYVANCKHNRFKLQT